jgi:hypothetical protein
MIAKICTTGAGINTGLVIYISHLAYLKNYKKENLCSNNISIAQNGNLKLNGNALKPLQSQK